MIGYNIVKKSPGCDADNKNQHQKSSDPLLYGNSRLQLFRKGTPIKNHVTVEYLHFDMGSTG